MIIDCVSDLHGEFPEMQGGDLLIIAGDCTSNDSPKAWINFFDWLSKQNYKKFIMVAGNHDNWASQFAKANEITNDEYAKMYPGEKPLFDYLQDSGTEFRGLKIWGAPWTPLFMGVNPKCKAFMLNEDELHEKFSLIPDNIDILVTHGPPQGILDCVSAKYPMQPVMRFGSLSLRNHVMRVKPKLHVFGHIHEQGGKCSDLITTKFYNVSIMDESYEPVHKPTRIIL